MSIDRERIMNRIKNFHDALVKVGETHSLEDFILLCADERVAQIVADEMKRRGLKL